MQNNIYSLSIVSAIYLKDNSNNIKKPVSSPHCMLQGKDDRVLLAKNKKPSVQCVHESDNITETLKSNEMCSPYDMNRGNKQISTCTNMDVTSLPIKEVRSTVRVKWDDKDALKDVNNIH